MHNHVKMENVLFKGLALWDYAIKILDLAQFTMLTAVSIRGVSKLWKLPVKCERIKVDRLNSGNHSRK